MKFIYAILILLPALALTADNPEKVLEKKLFGVLDADKDDKISEKEAETYFLSFDTNKDGEITLAELIVAVDKLDPQFVGKENALYKLFDRDSNGKVDKADIDAVFDLADSDKDYEIEEAEFHAIFAIVIGSVG